MDPSNQFCPTLNCSARGKTGGGTITIHDKQRRRYRCKVCKQTFSERRGTMFEGLRKPLSLIIIVVTLLAYGCPVQAIVQAFGLDEPTGCATRFPLHELKSWRTLAEKREQGQSRDIFR